MNRVYAFNLDTDHPGIYMTERIWCLLYRLFGRPDHWSWESVGGPTPARHLSPREEG